MILDENILKLYAQNKVNVLLSGRHGVGKTEIIRSVFDEIFGADGWAYFSASTMDAWVDFIGVPKAIDRGDGKMVLDLIRPARFEDGKLKALFFDEFNRAPAKVRNAVMELIQFKSINGKKFENLGVIWAAINPADEKKTYDVEELDPAQLDRFPVQINVPYKLDRAYMKNKHGLIAVPFCDWWKSLKQDIQYEVSPRRLEESIKIHKMKGDLTHVLPSSSNIKALLDAIANISLDDEWADMKKMNDKEKENFFNLENVTKFDSYILKEFATYAQFVPQDHFLSKLETKQNDWLKCASSLPNAVPQDVKDVMVKLYKDDFEGVINTLLGKSPKGSINLNNKNVVVTGKFEKSYKSIPDTKRDNVEKFLTDLGARVQSKVTSTTDYLIAANILNTSSKMVDAQQYVKNGTLTILQEEDFHDAFGNI